jgi:putative transposase
VGQHRSTQRHPAKVVSIEEGKLRNRLREIASALQSAPHGATHIL